MCEVEFWEVFKKRAKAFLSGPNNHLLTAD